MNLVIGLMSGTSMDGVDAALVDLDTNRLVSAVTKPYSENALSILNMVLEGEKKDYITLNRLNSRIGHEFADAVDLLLDHSGVERDAIQAIGSHGQTIFHDVEGDTPCSIQVGCGHTISERTGMTTVADFRTRDLVLGGQGAPFAPLYHQFLFEQKNESLALLNLGGIANVTFLDDSGKVSGFDIGPGNCLLDAWAKQHLGTLCDRNGEWGARGQIIDALLSALLADPFFNQKPPKSIGKEYFSLSWLASKVSSNARPEDVQATLMALTATLVSQTIQGQGTLLVCGGGVHNIALMNLLSEKLPNVSIKSTAELGINPDYIEAMMFAWLAQKTLNRIPVDLTTITGAKKTAILGSVYYSAVL